MYYKYYSVPNVSRTMQSAFYGLNKNARIGDGEFADMQNMSSGHAPLLSPRPPRTVAQKQLSVTDESGEVTYKNLNGILGDVGFAAVWGNDFYYMGKKIDGIALIDGQKKMLAFGAYILIYPDTVYYNTVSGEYGQMESGATETGTVTMRGVTEYPYTGNGALTLEDGTVNDSDAEIAVDYRVTENSSGIHYLYEEKKRPFALFFKQFSEWECVNYTDWIKKKDYLNARFQDGKLEYLYSMDMKYAHGGSGCDAFAYVSNLVWKTLPVVSFVATSAVSVSDTTNLWYGDEYIRFEGSTFYLSEPGNFGKVFSGFKSNSYYEAELTYTWTHKTLPSFDCVCVHENRLWGAKFGYQSTNTQTVNEIYCSALGDFKNWTVGTLAGDAYTASMGDYGKFTGCISHRGYVLFFKEDGIYRVSGTKPSNFQIVKIGESGLQEGCEKSMEIIDEVLYYKSRNGVYAYDGALPQKISDALGDSYYTDAVAGKHFSKYYITMVHDGVRKLYVYDTRYQLWHVEDGINARFFTEYDGSLYAGADNNIVCLSGAPAGIFAATEGEGDVTWYAETGDIGLSSPYQKYFRRLLIRMDMDAGARVTVELSCDGEDFTMAMDFTAAHKRSVQMPIVTPRCDHMRIRISGEGNAKIYSISYETETVGERPMRR